MIVDDLKQIKLDQRDFQNENRREINRLVDKVDSIKSDLQDQLTHHDRDIATLNSQAKMAGRIAGGVTGAITSLILTGVIAVASILWQNAG